MDIPLYTYITWTEAADLAPSCVVRHRPGLELETHVVVDPFLHHIYFGSPPPVESADSFAPRGGLLCDEMGLGKTVELMQLVLCNPISSHLLPMHKTDICQSSSTCFICCGSLETDYRTCCECSRMAHSKCVADVQVASMKYAYLCIDCCDSMERYCKEETALSEIPQSKATLVVVPTALLSQWKEELNKHVKDALEIIVFEGLKKSGYVPQKTLLNADVVLTTYSALRADMNMVIALRVPRQAMRHARRYKATPTPLMALRWHRVALDESQMVGVTSSLSKTAQMASFIRATYRWGVTGTPIARSPLDVEPMLRVIGLRYGNSEMDWKRLLKGSIYEEDRRRDARLIRNVMWRSTKEDISEEELQIPEQITQVVRVHFGPVEKYYYHSLQETVQRVTQNARCHSMQKVSTDLVTMLRQACCHPQIGISGRRLLSRAAVQALRQSDLVPSTSRGVAVENAAKRAQAPLSMEEVLKALVIKATMECEESLRDLVHSCNGLAAVSLLQVSALSRHSFDVDPLVTAIGLYRTVLNISLDNKDLVRLDGIQKMHVLFNLHDALQSSHQMKERLSSCTSMKTRESLKKLNMLGNTVRDDMLQDDVEVLRQKYLEEARNRLALVTTTHKELKSELGSEPLLDHLSEESGCEEMDDDTFHTQLLLRNPKGKDFPWWVITLADIAAKSEDEGERFLDKLVQKLLEAIPVGGRDIQTLATRLTCFTSIGVVIRSELEELQHARERFNSALDTLPGSSEPTDGEVMESGTCRKCREAGTGLDCAHCRSESLIFDVERHLYHLRESVEDCHEGLQTGQRQDHALLEPGDNLKSRFVSKRRRPSRKLSESSRVLYQSELEVILMILASHTRRALDDSVRDKMMDWFDKLGLIKEEHMQGKKVFETQRFLLGSMDEVKMALMRLSLLDDDVEFTSLTELQQRYMVPRSSVSTLNVYFSNGKVVAEADFKKKRGGLIYLKSLQRDLVQPLADGNRETKEYESVLKMCAVCLSEFKEVSQVAMLGCGHAFCDECVLAIIGKSQKKSGLETIRCPSCRVRCAVDDINFTSLGEPKCKKLKKQDSNGFLSSDTLEEGENISEDVKTKAKSNAEEECTSGDATEIDSSFYDEDMEVIGEYGTKASAIIRLLRSIWKKDENGKVLIFSEWNEVLDIFREALCKNKIPLCEGTHTCNQAAFAKIVDEFKTSKTKNVILLPFKRAGAGLNLTEARHVILTEPSMKVSVEAQAVGRVHRLGQKHVTYVHRIIVDNTIEDKIVQLGNAYRGKNGLVEDGTISVEDAVGAINASRGLTSRRHGLM